MADARAIDVQGFIDSHPFSRVQRRILLLCFLVVALDGFDVAIVGHIAPALRTEWALDVTSLGPLFAAGLFGLMLGSFIVGPLADRYGRKTLLVVSVLCFGGACLASAFSGGIVSLTWLRFLTGLGLGGAMPTAVTLTSEYCPTVRRSSLVTVMFCGFTIGSAIGGLAAAQVVTSYGWRPLLVVGGLLPLMFAPILAAALPESARYLVARDSSSSRVRATLQRIAPGADLTGASFAGPRKQTSSPVAALFHTGFVSGTVLLWITFFMSLLVVYLLSNWMPTLIQRSGLSLRRASLITAVFQIGGTVGAIVLGRLMDRFNPSRVLGVAYLAAAAFVSLMGAAASIPWLLAAAVFGAGFCVSGGQVGANALAATFYPTACRTTGVSWALAVGRGGSIVGSLIGGVMLAQGFSLAMVYGLVAVPALVAALCMLWFGVIRRATPAANRTY
jgi:AAHS family 4-hydroxybenzoate transporter-like MFS transporter